MKTGIFLVLSAFSLMLQGCSKDDGHFLGYIEGRFTYMASPVSGYLQKLAVARGESVRAGQLLYVLNSRPESDSLKQSEQKAAASHQQYVDMTLGQRPSAIRALEAEKKAAQALLVFSQKTFKRKQKLYDQGVLDAASRDQAQSQYLHDKAIVSQISARITTAQLGARIHQQKAQLDVANAARSAARESRWYLAKKTMHAFKAGRVNQTFYREGEYIQAGQPVLSELVPTEVKIVFFLPEPILGKTKVGEKIYFSCDSCKASEATIDYISPQVEYTPPVLYAQDARKSLVYRVEAAIPASVALSYHPGQPVDISLKKTKRS